MRIAWQAWRAYTHRAGQYQTRFWLAVIYLVILGPISLAARLAGSRVLDLRATGWLARTPLDNTVEALRRQF